MPRLNALRGLLCLVPLACDAGASGPDDPVLDTHRAAGDVLRVLPEVAGAQMDATPVEPYVRKGVAGALLASELRIMPGSLEDGKELSSVRLNFANGPAVPDVVLGRDDIGALLRFRGDAFHKQGTIRHAPVDEGVAGPPEAFLNAAVLAGNGDMYGIGWGTDDERWGYLVRTRGTLGGYGDSTLLYPKDLYDFAMPQAIVERAGSPDGELFVVGVVNVDGTRHSVFHRFKTDADGKLEPVDWNPMAADPVSQISLALPGCTSTEVSQLAWDETTSTLSAAGVKRCGGVRRAFVARLSNWGALDTTWGHFGVAELVAPGDAEVKLGGLVVDAGAQDAWLAMGVGDQCAPTSVGNGSCVPAVVKLDSSGEVDSGWGQPATLLQGQPGWVAIEGPAQERAGLTGIHRDGGSGVVTVIGWADRAISTDFMAARLDTTGAPDLGFGPDATSHVLFSTPAPGDSLRTMGLSPSGIPHFIAERNADDGRSRLVVQRHTNDGTTHQTSTSLAQEGMVVGVPFFRGEQLVVPGGIEALAREPAHKGEGAVGASFTRFRSGDFRLDWAGILKDGAAQHVAWPDLADLPSPWPSTLRVEVGFVGGGSHQLDKEVELVAPSASYAFPLDHEEVPWGGWHPHVDNGAHHDFRAHHRGAIAQIYALDMGAERWAPADNASYAPLACQETDPDPDADPEDLPLVCQGDWSNVALQDTNCPEGTFDEFDNPKCNERFAAWGMPVRAVDDGTVIGCWKTAPENLWAGDKSNFLDGSMPGGGNIVFVEHTDGTIALYAHMIPPGFQVSEDRFEVRQWDELSEEEKIAAKGRAVQRAIDDPLLDPDNLTLADLQEQLAIDRTETVAQIQATIDALDEVCQVEHTVYDANACARPTAKTGNGMDLSPVRYQVERGQVLGALGNSGNSTGPHAHVHVQQGFTSEDCGTLSSGVPTDYEVGMPMPFTVMNRLDDTAWGPAWWDISWGDEAVPPPITDAAGDVVTRVHLRWHEG